jgi:hypothetical protein
MSSVRRGSLFPVPALGTGDRWGDHRRTPAGGDDASGGNYGGCNAVRLSQLYKNHIWKEDNLLFPLAEKLLPTAEAESLLRAFRRVEQEIGVERLTELTKFGAELERS